MCGAVCGVLCCVLWLSLIKNRQIDQFAQQFHQIAICNVLTFCGGIFISIFTLRDIYRMLIAFEIKLCRNNNKKKIHTHTHSLTHSVIAKWQRPSPCIDHQSIHSEIFINIKTHQYFCFIFIRLLALLRVQIKQALRSFHVFDDVSLCVCAHFLTISCFSRWFDRFANKSMAAPPLSISQ